MAAPARARRRRGRVHRVARARETETLLAELEAAGLLLHVRPPDDAPSVSRTSTDLGLLGEALRVGHEAADRLLDGPPGRSS